jgi:hypothetical protein
MGDNRVQNVRTVSPASQTRQERKDMSQYIVTIVPVEDDGDAISGPVAQTVVRIETGTGRPAVKELTVRAPESAGLTGALPYVDFDMLLRAFIEPTDGRGRGGIIAPRPAAPEPVTASPKSRVARRAARSHGRPAKAARASALTAGRAYRKAPELGELEAVYEQVGTISGVAAHFEVPVHTAQGWISRMRRKNAEVSAT